MSRIRRVLGLGAVALAAGLGASQAQAATITGLFNTGVDASGIALVGGDGVVDPHWSIVTSTSAGFDGAQAVTYKHPAYAADDGDSRWVSLSSTGSPGGNVTLYRLSFDLTGLNSSMAQSSGSWGSENGSEILLNGVSTGFTTGNFAVLTTFSLSSGFVAGVNNLDIRVTDAGAPTAFRFDNLAGTADLPGAGPGGVPEPATWAMMLLGFMGTGSVLRARRGALRAA